MNHHQRPARFAATLSAALAAVLLLCGCAAKTRLIEQFDNGPLTATGFASPGRSEGLFWVKVTDAPGPGKSWRSVDPDNLTPEQEAGLRGR